MLPEMLGTVSFQSQLDALYKYVKINIIFVYISQTENFFLTFICVLDFRKFSGIRLSNESKVYNQSQSR